ncbi:MAG: DNA modification methylase [Candidatus Latescibacterota bacterium]|nr:MAG: DNA modification methylase [Candidatus Latescibacterota bacterium]
MKKIKSRIRELRYVEGRDLVPAANNWRKHPPHQKQAIKAALNELGFVDAVLAREEDGKLVLIDGHLRQDVAKKQQVPVLVLDVTEEEANKIMATLDPLAGMAEGDADALTAVLEGMQTENEDFAALLAEIAGDYGALEADLGGEEEEEEDEETAIPPEPPTIVVSAGETWLCGKHRLLIGDVLEGLAGLPNECAQTVVTSPPYWGLRDYGIEGQIGLEESLEDFLEKIVAVFREIRRVLRKDGTLWVNMGDAYAQTGTKLNTEENVKQAKERTKNYKDPGIYGDYVSRMGRAANTAKRSGLKAKDMLGQPWRLAFALQADGWFLRSDVIWHKPNAFPESVTDRPIKAYEHVFLISKSARYFYDADAVRENSGPYREWTEGGNAHYKSACGNSDGNPKREKGSVILRESVGRSLRDVWVIPTQAMPDAHFATFPEKLVVPCIKAGTSERGCCDTCGKPWVRNIKRGKTNWEDRKARGEPMRHGKTAAQRKASSGARYTDGKELAAWKTDHPDEFLGWKPACKCNAAPAICLVLDPFGGSGTTMIVAEKLGRRAILTELSPAYAQIALMRYRKLTGQEPTRDGDGKTLAELEDPQPENGT